MRNSKVFDIIKELEEFKCNVEVYDYWIDESDKKTKPLNFLESLPLNSERYDAIIVAVNHDKFKDITTGDYKGMSRGEPIVLDVKGIVEKPTWRL
jgi:UDP-N-acetyl-D-galactosamine dehydrogenase